MTNTALPINASGGTPAYSAQQFRQAMSALMVPGTTRILGTTSGYCPGRQPSTLTVTTTTWTIGPFAAIIDPAFTTTQAPYLIATDANNTAANVSAANATNPRIDILYAQVNDTDIDSSGSRNVTVAYLAGTAAASPTPPATPARSFVLATINVPQSGGGSPTITVNSTFAVASGGVLPVSSSTVYPATPYKGMTIYDLALGYELAYNGSAWAPTSVGAWTTYTPTWTAASGGTSIGNGGISASFQVVAKTLLLRLYCAFGSTTTFGTGSWSFSLPAGVTSANLYQGGLPGVAFDSSTGARWVVTSDVGPSATTFNVTPARDAGSFVCDASRPFTWASADTLYLGPGQIQIA